MPMGNCSEVKQGSEVVRSSISQVSRSVMGQVMRGVEQPDFGAVYP